MNDLLPPELTAGATLREREYAWRVSSFPSALANAPRLGYACLGGQFQFRLDDATVFEMYWLESNSVERTSLESLEHYAHRSCREVSVGFEALVEATDFREQAARYVSLKSLLDSDWDPLDHLVFNAYFVTEQELARLKR